MLGAAWFLSLLLLSDVWSKCPKPAAINITAPQNLWGLSRSCLEIPCSFTPNSPEEFDGGRTTYGVWIKNDSRFAQNEDNVVFNSSKTRNALPMNFTGNLSARDCTTLFHNLRSDYSDTYYFRVENRPFLSTASCHPLKIKILDSPPKPQIIISGVLREAEAVSVTCTAVAPCPLFPPRLRWNLEDSRSQTARDADRVLVTQILTRIRLTEQSDGLRVTCNASYPVDHTLENATQEKILNVSYAPKDTQVSVSPEGSLSAGTSVNLSCSSRAKPPVSNFTWFWSSQGGDGAKSRVWQGRNYTFILTQGGVYRCEARNHIGTGSAEIRLTLEGQEKFSSSTGGAVAGVVLVVLLLGAVAAALWFKRRLATSQQAQSAAQPSSAAARTEDVHYAQIDYHKKRAHKASSPESTKDVHYAQIDFSKTSSPASNSGGQPSPLCGPEPVYAQVKIRQ